ncbi:MAG: DNA internalization-related competence protein ComEC/Rec2 [Syntrophotaleaceae bacterium]
MSHDRGAPSPVFFLFAHGGLPVLFCCFTLGLLLAPFFSPWPLLPPLLLFLGLFWLTILSRTASGFWFLPLLFLLFGTALYHLHLQPPRSPRHISVFADSGIITLQGTVFNTQPREGQGCFLDVDVKTVFRNGSAGPSEGRMRLFIEEALLPPAPGDRIRFSAKLKRPRPFGTPGEFNYPRYLAARGIFITAFLENTKDLVRFSSEKGPGLRSRIARFRQETGRRIDRTVNPETAPLVRALVIGDGGSISGEQRELLARAGISHLFAISGLHLGLVALLLFSLFRFLYGFSEKLLLFQPPGRFLPLALLPLLWLYLQLAGNPLSARRAFLMAALAALLLTLARRTPPLRILLAVAFAMLCWSPLSLFEASFQLSFAGLGGILIFLPRWQKYLQQLPRLLLWPAGTAAATLAATITTLPLVLLHFHLLAPAGLLTNLVCVPLIGFGAVPAGLAGLAVGPLLPEAGAVLFKVCEWMTALAWNLCRHSIDVPILSGQVVYPAPWMLGILSCIVIALILPFEPRFRPARVLLLGTMAVLFVIPFSAGGEMTLTALSVGQGDSLLLTRPDGSHYLIDGGGFSRGTFDTGARLVGPALGRLGIRSLDAVILTHDHPDHRRGLVHILEHFPVKSFWCAEQPERLDPELLTPLQERNIPVKTFPPGWTFPEETKETATLGVFVPDQPPDRLNDRSLVLYARHGEDGVLLTGDLEKAGVEELLRKTPDLPISLLKLPHHGSRHSLPWLLTERFEPRLVFASQGYGNPYGLPHPEVVAALQRQNLTLLRTDCDGTLRFHSRGSGWRCKRWCNGLFH